MKKLLWAAILLVGCGIPNDKPIGELSDDEKDKICDKVEASSDVHLRRFRERAATFEGDLPRLARLGPFCVLVHRRRVGGLSGPARL